MSYTAKSVVFDIADNHGGFEVVGLRSIEFKLLGALVSLTTADFSVYQTSYRDPWGHAEFAFTTGLSKTADSSYVSMIFGYGELTNLRMTVVFNTPVEFDSIVVNNYHTWGWEMATGVNNVKIYTHDSAVTSTVYGNGVSGYSLIFDDTIAQHVGSDVSDDQELSLVAPPPAPDGILAGVPTLGTPAGVGTMNLTAGVPTLGTPAAVYIAAVEGILTGAPVPGNPGGDFQFVVTENARLIYTLVLTGTPDLELNFQSVQCRLRTGAESYLSVVVPGFDFAEEINDRADGQLVVYASYLVAGVSRLKSEIARVNLETINTYEGPVNKSITLTGYRQETYTPKAIDLPGATYKSLVGGVYTFRFAEPNLDLKPGDEVTVGAETITANVISYYISASRAGTDTRMEISEG